MPLGKIQTKEPLNIFSYYAYQDTKYAMQWDKMTRLLITFFCGGELPEISEILLTIESTQTVERLSKQMDRQTAAFTVSNDNALRVET